MALVLTCSPIYAVVAQTQPTTPADEQAAPAAEQPKAETQAGSGEAVPQKNREAREKLSNEERAERRAARKAEKAEEKKKSKSNAEPQAQPPQEPVKQPQAEPTAPGAQAADTNKKRTEPPQANPAPAPADVKTNATVEKTSPAASASKKKDKAAPQEAAPKTAEQPVAQPQPSETVAAPVEQAPPAVVKDKLTAAERENLARAEQERRERKRKNRNKLIGAAAAGAVIGAVIRELGGKVVADEGDLIIVERDGRRFVRKDENERLRRGGANVTTEQLPDGRQRTRVLRPNGVEVITVRDSGGYIIRRVKVLPNGDRIVLIDNQDLQPSQRRRFREELSPLQLNIARSDYVVESGRADRRRIRETFSARPVEMVERAYTLNEIRDSERLRAKVRRVDLDTITFDTGSASLTQSQVSSLTDIGDTIAAIIQEDPREIFLIEGHTDAVGSDLSNLALSDRRAETIARILTDSFGVPPENMVVQGYGEQYLKIQTEYAERENRRVTVRRITPLLNPS
ncbi:MAG: OmpA family protein [Rhizobiales bacterium]|nr:OmpA family protein [Hyphomicrobiales bacterium]